MARVNVNLSQSYEDFSIIERYCKEKGLSKSEFMTGCSIEHIRKDESLKEKLVSFDDNEHVIIHYTINSPKKILEIKKCSDILDDF